MQPDTTYGARAAPYRALPRTYGAQAPYLRSGRCTRGCGSVRSGPTRSRTRPPQTDAKSDAHRPQSGAKSVTAPDRPGSHCFVSPSRNPPNAAWLCRSVRADTTTCVLLQWAKRDSNPLLFPEGFEATGESGAESGTRSGRCGRRGGRARGHGARGRRDGCPAAWARPRAHRATWGLLGRVARGQRVDALGSHGSSLTRTHALGPTERLLGTIEFVSGARHRCHRYRNWQFSIQPSPLRPS